MPKNLHWGVFHGSWTDWISVSVIYSVFLLVSLYTGNSGAVVGPLPKLFGSRSVTNDTNQSFIYWARVALPGVRTPSCAVAPSAVLAGGLASLSGAEIEGI